MKITIESETLNATTEDFDTAIEILQMLAAKNGQIVHRLLGGAQPREQNKPGNRQAAVRVQL